MSFQIPNLQFALSSKLFAQNLNDFPDYSTHFPKRSLFTGSRGHISPCAGGHGVVGGQASRDPTCFKKKWAQSLSVDIC